MVDKDPEMSKDDQRKLAKEEAQQKDRLSKKLLEDGGEATGQEIPKTNRGKQRLN